MVGGKDDPTCVAFCPDVVAGLNEVVLTQLLVYGGGHVEDIVISQSAAPVFFGEFSSQDAAREEREDGSSSNCR